MQDVYDSEGYIPCFPVNKKEEMEPASQASFVYPPSSQGRFNRGDKKDSDDKKNRDDKNK